MAKKRVYLNGKIVEVDENELNKVRSYDELAPTYFNNVRQSTKIEDIAPVKFQKKIKEKKQKQWWEEILETPEAFKDGYDFGDGIKTILGSTADAGLNAIEGVGRVGEGIAKVSAGLIAEGMDLFGDEKGANKIRKRITEEMPISKGLNWLEDQLDDYSVFGNTGDEIFSGIGYTTGMIYGGKVLPSGGNISLQVGQHVANLPILSAVGGMSSGLEEAYSKGATGVHAWSKVLGSGVIESVTESMFGFMGVGGNDITDEFAKKFTNKFSSGIAQNLAKLGVSSTAEGLEEVISSTANQFLDKTIDKFSKDDAPKFYEKLDPSNLAEEFVTTFLSTALQGGYSGVVSTHKLSKNAISNMEQEVGRKLTAEEKSNIRDQVARAFANENTLNEQRVADYELNNRLSKIENATSKDRARLRYEINQDLQNGKISIDSINNSIGDMSEQWNNQFKELQEIKRELETTDDKAEKKYLQQQYNHLLKNYNQDNNLRKSYVEEMNKSKDFSYSLDDNASDFVKTTYQSATELQFNNTKTSHDTVDFVSKLADYTRTNIKFTNNEQLQKMGLTVQGETVNGVYRGDDNSIYINMDSPKATRSILGHEIGHLLDNTSEGTKLREFAKKYAQTKGEYDSRMEILQKNYANIKNANLDIELTNDIIGDYLFSDESFVTQMATEQPSTFKKIYNWFKHIFNLTTKGSKEARQLEQVRYNLEKGLAKINETKSSNTKTADNEIKYSTRGNVEKNNKKVYNKGKKQNSINKNGIYIENTQEYGSLRATVRYLQSQNIITDGINGVENGKYFYAIESNGFDNYIPIMRIQIEGNEALIDSIRELINNGAYDNTKTLSEYVEIYSNERGRYNTSDASIEGRNTTTRNDRLYSGEQGQYQQTNDHGKNDAISKELDNSSFSLQKQVQGLENYSKQEIKNLTLKHINKVIVEQDIDANIKAIELHGSRLRGDNKANSDLDVVVQYEGNIREDDLFNLLNEDRLKIEDVEIDINPITEDINDYMERSREYDKEVLSNHNKYSLEDSEGKKLNKEQQKFFKNSKIRDDKGRLLTLYHGTRNDFTVFDKNKSGESSKQAKVGFWFTETEKGAEDFANSVWYGKNKDAKAMKVYLNIKNPMIYDTVDNTIKINNLEDKYANLREQQKVYRDKYRINSIFTSDDGRKFLQYYGMYSSKYSNYTDEDMLYYIRNDKDIDIKAEEYLEDIKQYTNINKDMDSTSRKITNLGYGDAYERFRSDIYKFAGMDSYDANVGGTGMAIDNENEVIEQYITDLKNKGYDGIIIRGTQYDTNTFGKENNQYVAFESNQIKNADNINPTNNEDIRYSLEDLSEEDIAPVKESLTKTIPKSYEPFLEFAIENGLDDTDKNIIFNGVDKEKKPTTKEKITTPREEYKNEPKVLPEKPKWKKTIDLLDYMFLNRNSEADNLAKKTGNKNIKYYGDMLNSVAGEIDGEIYTAQTNNYGEAIGKSIKELFEWAHKEGVNEAFSDYLLHYSNIDRHKRGKGSLIKLGMSKKMVKYYEKEYPQFKQHAQEVWQFSENVLQNFVEAGIITESYLKSLRDMYPHYVPYIQEGDIAKYIDEEGKLKPLSTIKTARGGATHSALTPVEDALIKYVTNSKKQIRKNDYFREIYLTLGGKNNFIGLNDANVLTDNKYTGLFKDYEGNYLSCYISGDLVGIKISDELYNQLEMKMENYIKDLEQKLELITKPIQAISNVRRNILTTWSPSFVIKNPIKDFGDALINSTDVNSFLKNYVPAFMELNDDNNQLANQFKTLYGSGNVQGVYESDSVLSKEQKTIKTGKGIFQKVASFNEIVELVPRYAEFKSTIQRGGSIQEAMYNAREVTINFNRGGVVTKALNRNGFTFLNASVQGLNKFVRNFSGENGTRGIITAILKATLVGITPALLNHLWYTGGDEPDEEYESIPDYIKDNYFLIKRENGDWIRIPKGRVPAVFGIAARRTLEYAQGEEDAFDGIGSSIYSQVGVNNPSDNNIFAPIRQAFFSGENGKAWYGGDLVPTRLQDKPAGEQYDESTDAISKWIGAKFGISPYKLNYVLDQYSGGIGDIVLPMLTEEANSDAETIPEYMLAPIKDQFVINTTMDNKYSGDFYDTKDKLNVKSNSMYATDEDILKNKYMSSVSAELGKLYQEKRKVQTDSSLSKKQKYKKVKNIQDEINKIAKEGLEGYNQLSKTDYYAIVSDREFYYDDEKQEWKKVNDDELEKLDLLGLDLSEKSSYFHSKNDISDITKEYKELTENASDEEKEVLNKQKKIEIINTIKNSDMTDETKTYSYTKHYGDYNTVSALTNLGIKIDDYMELEAQDFTSDKYTNGKTVTNSKKKKVINYINSMKITPEQKIILAKLKYPSMKTYNVQIVNYLQNNKYLDYDEKMILLKRLGFKIENHKVTW